MFIRSICRLAMLLLSCVGTANAALVSVYTDQSAWENSLSGAAYGEEKFDAAAAVFPSASTANLAAVTITLVGASTGLSLTGSGFIEGKLVADSSVSGAGLNFVFASPLRGFALLGLQNDSRTNAAGLDLEEMGVVAAGEFFLLSEILGLSGPASPGSALADAENTHAIPFIGFVGTSALSGFSLHHTNQIHANGASGNVEEFYLDGLLFAPVISPLQAPQPLTEPGLLPLMLGLMGLLLCRRGVGIRNAA